MSNTIALIQSKTFWASVLALAAIVAQQFGWAKAVGIATDPATVNDILNGVAMLGAVGAILFRGVAKSQVTSLLPPGSTSKTSAHAWLALPLFLAIAFGFSGCLTTTQTSTLASGVSSLSISQSQVDALRSTYDAAVLTPAAAYRQLGYCKTGTSATLAKPCADRALVAKLQAIDGQVAADFNTTQALINSGNNTGLSAAYSLLQQAIVSGETLAATLAPAK
jgi:uncharacterized membrane protein